ncbi:NAD(P)-dependent oxidoreductase [Sulfitobacter mediterraneus]|uniref:NAD(P)-dependent oxidoreductase n=1 Tax=Sulfitobacter mediterraneus TaxID=83219 RepID=UPI001933CCD6|nr:NAD(P)-dependent oxidoreductase [Sulfitobacter mediterraneus]MBM1311217.1 NAD(P)-dependent oxidoreductase [Sulfitobacter mediterraneus]MBM1315099.1 NAD(P)-dependent oxidoreductase [Sulfitobacter mediterraneus]MBM1323460.1 NAD(P)-dependent oxidoreductase [Sulfitobacter mediterraneus]MBM1327372.1 NAD(P)-dependent oxidoreductase [Sulfitobacter mediterraneus]MBM1398720.1 NAD(P)-dependent oxidoreductase [Sulfitobacter mediterraneus]
MSSDVFAEGIKPGRLDQESYEAQFSDLHPPLDAHEALVAADRCYFCHDAPCITACPTDIDIPLFIRQIATGTPDAAAKTILSQNIMGGMCARVCPTETLCEEACVRELAEGKPVLIGQLQRYATDHLQEQGVHPFERGAATGKKVAVVGAGPAGLSAAHRLAMMGHDVVVHDARPKPGGLNEYGIAAYKTPDGFAQGEVDWLLKIGGITLQHDAKLGQGITLQSLRDGYDAVFLGIGLGGVNALGAEGEDKGGVTDAVDFIADLRQASDLATVPIGRDVVVIGGGMTAVDAAVQAKLLGALNVTLVYRRGRDRMNASAFEQDLAASKGVRIVTHAVPKAVHGNGAVREIEFEYVDEDMNGTGQTLRLAADQVFKAIGQTLEGDDLPELDGRKIKVDGTGRTSLDGVWAGGDCASGGDDLTVTAVAEGRDAAMDMHGVLVG